MGFRNTWLLCLGSRFWQGAVYVPERVGYVGSGPDPLYGLFPPWTGRVDFLIPYPVDGLQKYQHASIGKLVLAKVGFVDLSPQASVCSSEDLQCM